ncbi:type IV pilus biogenesis protein PilM [Moorella sulfitireducens]|uniref:type IV pilus biogenesis protein PilM n=1 Tax=Neomoorella sulfitireducens TaxID=2972948 RepID=UPI0021ACC609|nr:pilus assembly protein PilM [Moorella sulfitireducens]
MIGLVIDSRESTWVRVHKKGDRLRVDSYGSCPTPAGAVQNGIVRDPADLGAALKAALQPARFFRERVAVCLSGLQFFVRSFSLAGLKPRDTARAVRYKVAAEVPIPLEDLVVDYRLPPGAGEAIMAVATRRTNLQQLVLALKLAGTAPRVIDIEPYCLLRAATGHRDDGRRATAILSLNRDSPQFSFFLDNILRFHRFLPAGNGVTGGEAGFWSGVAPELERSLAFCRQEFYRTGAIRVLVTGIPLPPEIAVTLENQVAEPPVYLTMVEGIELSPALPASAATELAAGWTTALGLVRRRR